MTKIDLSKFLQNNFDEFVHLRALKNVIDQVDSINAQQDTNITHAQSTADTAQQTATTAKTTADQAESDAKKAQADADTKSTINYQKADGTGVFAPVMTVADVKRQDIDNGQTSVGKGFMFLDSNNRPIEFGLANQLLSIQGGMKMFVKRTIQTTTELKLNVTADNSVTGTFHGWCIPILQNGDSVPFYAGSMALTGVTLSELQGIDLELSSNLPDYWGDERLNATMFIHNDNNLVSVPGLLTKSAVNSLHLTAVNELNTFLNNLDWLKTGPFNVYVRVNDIF